MLLDFFNRTADRLACGAAYSCPKNADEKVSMTAETVVDHLLWPAGQPWRTVRLPTHREQNDRTVAGTDRIPLSDHVTDDLMFFNDIAGEAMITSMIFASYATKVRFESLAAAGRILGCPYFREVQTGTPILANSP
jgi:hypothetical protein